jgi:predicted alpha/beta superfamily hydrolase
VSDNNVRFLTEELLPHVAKEYGLNLSATAVMRSDGALHA